MVEDSLLSDDTERIQPNQNIPLLPLVPGARSRNTPSVTVHTNTLGSSSDNNFSRSVADNQYHQQVSSHELLMEEKANPVIEALREHSKALGP